MGFVAYESYLPAGRDTKRIMLLEETSQALQAYTLKNTLPTPEESIDIIADSETIAIQGNITQTLYDMIELKNIDEIDDQGIYTTYSVTPNKGNFQLLSFLEDQKSRGVSFIPQSFAIDYLQDELIYTAYFPHALGSQIGIYLDDTYFTPFQQKLGAGSSYDVETWTGARVYFGDNSFYDIDEFATLPDRNILLPNSSCRRILDLAPASPDGGYTLKKFDATSLISQSVECDMRNGGVEVVTP